MSESSLIKAADINPHDWVVRSALYQTYENGGDFVGQWISLRTQNNQFGAFLGNIIASMSDQASLLIIEEASGNGDTSELRGKTIAATGALVSFLTMRSAHLQLPAHLWRDDVAVSAKIESVASAVLTPTSTIQPPWLEQTSQRGMEGSLVALESRPLSTLSQDALGYIGAVCTASGRIAAESWTTLINTWPDADVPYNPIVGPIGEKDFTALDFDFD